MIEAAAQAQFCVASVATKFRNSTPQHTTKAMMTYVAKVANQLLGDGADAEVLGIAASGLREAREAVVAAGEAKF